jgi:hypothetical protein
MTIPKIEMPGITRKDFEKAFAVLEASKAAAPACGFRYPFFSPGAGGAYYGANWWQLDCSIALDGYKWADQTFCETAVLNFIETQKEDGRIMLWGNDGAFEFTEMSSLPKLFAAGYNIARRSADAALVDRIYTMLNRYMRWWAANRRDERTGLFTAVFEETFVPYWGKAGERAPVDTNMELAAACALLAKYARHLGREGDEAYFKRLQAATQNAVNEYLWDGEKGAYYAYLLKEGRREDLLLGATFMGMRLDTAVPERRSRLLALLKDDGRFNWDRCAVTSCSRKDPQFTVTTGDYKGNPSWLGGVWTLINENAVLSLKDAGEYETAAELARKTVAAFGGNYAEFLNPDDGMGHGVQEYAWTAAHCILLIVEHIFGIEYDRFENKIFIRPLPVRTGERLSLSGLPLPDGASLDVELRGGDPAVRYKVTGKTTLAIEARYL